MTQRCRSLVRHDSDFETQKFLISKSEYALKEKKNEIFFNLTKLLSGIFNFYVRTNLFIYFYSAHR